MNHYGLIEGILLIALLVISIITGIRQINQGNFIGYLLAALPLIIFIQIAIALNQFATAIGNAF